MTVLDELRWRGLIADCTDPADLEKKIGGPITLYCGFDPTAESLHVGNLIPLIALRRFQQLGFHPIAVAGGATGSIGDPSGKAAERQLLTPEQLEHNITRIKGQLSQLLEFDPAKTPLHNPARLMDNASWTRGLSFLDFLRDIGKYFSVNQMVSKESVRARMEDRKVGISYTEFSYMLLQAFDFMVLCRDHNCELQIGGSDQWGNITAGIELTRKKLGRQVFGLTLPLITNADGSKFGKSEAGAVWLDPKKTSVYKFYQFWINTDDRDVIRYLKFFSVQRSRADIEALAEKHRNSPQKREAHRALAAEMTYLIHGEEALHKAQIASAVLFGESGDILNGTTNFFEDIDGEVPTQQIEKSALDGEGLPLVDLVVRTGLCSSKGQARKEIEAGGIFVNNERQRELDRNFTAKDLIHGHLLLRKGRRNYLSVMAR